MREIFINFVIMNLKDNNIEIIKNLPLLLNTERDYLLLKDIPSFLEKDFKNFIIGITVYFDSENNLIIGKNLFKKWIFKLWTKGFDYEISI